MFAQMTIGKKLTAGFAGLMVCVVGLSYFSLAAIGTLRDELDVAANKSARKLDLAGAINKDIAQMRAEVRGTVLATATKNKGDFETARGNFGEVAGQIEQALKEIRPLLVTESAKKGADAVESGLSAWKQIFGDIERLCAAGRLEDAIQLRKEKESPIAKGMAKGADDILEEQRESLASATKQAMAETTSSRWAVIVCIGLTLLIGAIILFVVRMVSRSLRQTAAELAEGAEQVASAASQVSSSSQSLAQGSSEQAATLEQTSASSEEINSMARKNSENSRGAADLVTQSQQKFVQTNQSLEQMVAAMGEINTQSGKIAKIIKVIDEIAFQTNILALNAAVEAARAGEAGMGFAVVADEVRNLAQRCAQAAKDTSALIEESIAKSNDGKTKVDQVATAIRAITEESSRVKTLVDEVNLGSEEQARGIEQIGKAITQMEQVTQKTAANAEESASAAEELNAQSETLKEIVDRLAGMVGGDEATNGHAPRPIHRKAVTASAKAPAGRRPGESASGFSALRKDVAHQPKSAENGSPILIARGTSKDAFPLEEQFKEF
jgi:methyl-accepting chemotaxis protein